MRTNIFFVLLITILLYLLNQCLFTNAICYAYNYSELSNQELENLANYGDADAAIRLGFNLLNNDRTKACKWLGIAAAKGKAVSAYNYHCKHLNNFRDNSPQTQQNYEFEKNRENEKKDQYVIDDNVSKWLDKKREDDKKNQQMIDDYIMLKSFGIF